MLERIWTSILQFLATIVIPDWGALIVLIPVGLFILIVVVLLRTFRMLLIAPKPRRGMRRMPPRTPAGIHMPGPSFAPVFAAIGVSLLLLGLVFDGIILLLGAIALGLTLLYWLAEAIRLYDRDISMTASVVPAATHGGPPPGVHMPGPSYRPFLGALGVSLLMLGLVFGGWLLPVGVIALVSTLLGWLGDARQEYAKTVEADSTGHLENIPAARTPSRLLGTLTVLLIGAVIIQSGVFASKQADGATGGATASGQPASGPPAAGGPAASQAPAADVLIQAQGVKFVQSSIIAPANKAFTIAFDNQDPGTPHNVELNDASGAIVFKGEIFPGVATRVYNVPPLTAGKYTFICIVHPSMTGTATLE